MAPNPDIMKAVERLNYRVTVGDVASQAGLEVNLAQQGLLVLASEASGHLQVAESGDVVYLFPKNFRDILRNKYFRLQLQEWWETVWRVLFYLIRISFGIVLILSIALITIAIILITIAATSSNDDERGSNESFSMPSVGLSGWDIWWLFAPDYYAPYADSPSPRRTSGRESGSQLNFLEAVFSFLFGDGNPNRNLEERRWQTIGTVISNQRGSVIAEQIAPYLDSVGQGYSQEYEDYMLPVLARFNGYPQVSPDGDIIYQFPDLQTTAQQRRKQPVAGYLQERPWQFSQASSGQILGAIGLGSVNLVGALVLGNLLANGAANLGGFVAFVGSIYGVLLAYGVGFLLIPLVRYFWIQGRNRQILQRNQARQALVNGLEGDRVQAKLTWAEQFAAETVIDQSNLAYTTERDLIEQEIEQADKIDAEWQQRLEGRN